MPQSATCLYFVAADSAISGTSVMAGAMKEAVFLFPRASPSNAVLVLKKVRDQYSELLEN
jgi:hypothetical protein